MRLPGLTPLACGCLSILIATAASTALAGNCDRPAADARTEEAIRARLPAQRARLARKALALCASHAGAHNALGTAFEELGDAAQAEVEYRRAAEQDRSWYLPLVGLGDLARAKGDLQAAEDHYRRASQLAKTDRERETAERALRDLQAHPSLRAKETPRGGYSYKSADAISQALNLSGEARPPVGRGFGAAEAVRDDAYVSALGLAINLSILFKVNSADLLPAGIRQLDEVGKALQASDPKTRFRIEGHASSDGVVALNRLLSERRAASVREYLLRQFSLSPLRFEIVGRGSEVLVMEAGHENREKSRRVTLIRKFDQ